MRFSSLLISQEHLCQDNTALYQMQLNTDIPVVSLFNPSPLCNLLAVLQRCMSNFVSVCAHSVCTYRNAQCALRVEAQAPAGIWKVSMCACLSPLPNKLRVIIGTLPHSSKNKATRTRTHCRKTQIGKSLQTYSKFPWDASGMAKWQVWRRKWNDWKEPFLYWSGGKWEIYNRRRWGTRGKKYLKAKTELECKVKLLVSCDSDCEEKQNKTTEQTAVNILTSLQTS